MMFVDYRENRSRVPELLKQFHVPVQIANLEADYMISKYCFVERKTASDFVASILDKRIFQQVSHLREVCTNPLIILEGDIARANSNISANSIRGVVLWIMFDKKVPVLQTRNEYTTACMLRQMYYKYDKSFQIAKKIQPRKRKVKSFQQQQADMLTQIPGIGRQIAKDLLASYGSVGNILSATDSELVTTSRIGRQRLDAIRHSFS